MISGIYKLYNSVNNKFYIGSSQDIEYRTNFHLKALKNNKHYNTYLQHSYNKYGDVFKYKIIEECEIELLIERETYYYNMLTPDYNLRAIGEYKRGYKHTDETKLKLKHINTGRKGYKHTDEAKRKIGDTHKNKSLSDEHKIKLSNSHLGKRHSEETKNKMSKVKKGHVHSDEAKKNMSNAKKGQTISEETKNKISLANTGKKHSDETKLKMKNKHVSKETSLKISLALKGHIKSESTCKKISKSKKGHIVDDETKHKISETLKSKPLSYSKQLKAVSIDENIEHKFYSVSAAKRFIGVINPHSIYKCCNGEIENYKGYKWEWLNN